MLKTENWFKAKLSELKDDFDFRLEKLILDVTEKIAKRMVRKKYSRVKLAKKLEISAPAVTKMLDGNSNFTLRSLLSLADALDTELKIDFQPKKIAEQKPVSYWTDISFSSANDFIGSKASPQYPAIESSSIQGVETDITGVEKAA